MTKNDDRGGSPPLPRPNVGVGPGGVGSWRPVEFVLPAAGFAKTRVTVSRCELRQRRRPAVWPVMRRKLSRDNSGPLEDDGPGV
jgi:hypothetical protein